ncbi:cysteine hydrolase family protein [Virgibacillus flavescens]|uniref:cysteine hydrolase family protein n=1 Tax=Virgibacillus flavescens TaxID=1611422 RepID=UPI003D32AA57
MTSVLLIIDVQKGMFTMDTSVSKGNLLLENITRMITFAREHNLPLIYIQHNGPANSPLEKNTPGWEIHEVIKPQNGDIVIEKHTPDSFYETDLKNILNNMEVNHLIVTGIQTEACIDSTCRSGFSLNYDVTLAIDCHSTFDKEEISARQIINHHNEVLRWFAETKTLQEITSA